MSTSTLAGHWLLAGKHSGVVVCQWLVLWRGTHWPVSALLCGLALALWLGTVGLAFNVT